MRLSSGACRDVRVALRHTFPDGYGVSVDFEVWRGRSYQDTGFACDDNVTGPVRDTYLYCPYQGFGRFRVGPSRVDWNSPDYDRTGHFRDGTRGFFTVKQDSRVRRFAVTRTGRTVRLTGVATFYSDDMSR